MTMLALLLALQPTLAPPAAVQGTPAPVASPTMPAAPVAHTINWAALPPLPYRRTPRLTAPMMTFVAAEMRRRQCPMPQTVYGRVQLQTDVAVLIGADGTVRATIPRAIGCPVVEQYAAGLVVSFTRNNLVKRLTRDGNWYRASMVFDWAQ